MSLQACFSFVREIVKQSELQALMGGMFQKSEKPSSVWCHVQTLATLHIQLCGVEFGEVACWDWNSLEPRVLNPLLGDAYASHIIPGQLLRGFRKLTAKYYNVIRVWGKAGCSWKHVFHSKMLTTMPSTILLSCCYQCQHQKHSGPYLSWRFSQNSTNWSNAFEHKTRAHAFSQKVIVFITCIWCTPSDDQYNILVHLQFVMSCELWAVCPTCGYR